MAEAIYLMCALTSTVCSLLLIRGWRKSRVRLLVWSGACFAGLAVANVLLFVDLVIVADVDLSILRTAVALASLLALLVGMIWEARA